MTRKFSYNKSGIGQIPIDKPIKYEIQTAAGKTNYVGVAVRGRGQDRLIEHLPGSKDPVPGSQVKVTQYDSIAEARVAEARTISSHQPKYNKQGM